MIRSLRRKFIAMTMAVFLAMLCVIFGLVIHFTGENLEAESIRTLRQAAAEPLQPGIPGQLRQPCFIIRATPWGQSVVTTGGFDLSDEAMLTEIVTQGAASRTESGTVEGDCQKALAELGVARRGRWDDGMNDSIRGAIALWERMTEGVK